MQATREASAAGASQPGAARATASSAEYVVEQIKAHRKGLAVALALILLFVVLPLGGYALYRLWSVHRHPEGVAAQPLSFQNAKITRLTTTGRATSAAISPDGRYVVYASSDGGRQSLWMRQTATQSNVEIVAPAEVEYSRLVFSPDGNYLFYVTRESGVAPTLYQIPALGGTPKKLLSGVGYMALSPDASQIAFVRDLPAEGAQALVVSNIDGTAERRLAVCKLPERLFTAGSERRSPAWSPDGRVIACPVINNDGGILSSVVMAIDVASGQERTISQKFYSIRDVAWLPDGGGLLVLAVDQAAAAQAVGPGRGQIWLLSYPEGDARRVTNDLNSYRTISLTADSGSFVTVQNERTAAVWVAPQADSSRARQITNGAGRTDLNVRWTPTGKIVFDSDAGGRAAVWTMDADGGNQKQLTTEDAEGLSVSPDGSLIAFQSFRTGASHVYLMDAGGGNVRQLTNGSGEYGASFSPDGKWVLYASRAPGKLTVWRIPVEGGEPRQVIDKRSYGARVSPDGKWLATTYNDEQPNALDKVAIIPFDGGAPVKLFDIPNSGGQIDLHWTPDSRALIYIVTRGGVSNLWQQPVEGGAPRQLTDFKSGNIFSFDYSRDSRQLALSRGTVNDDVVLIKNFR